MRVLLVALLLGVATAENLFKAAAKAEACGVDECEGVRVLLCLISFANSCRWCCCTSFLFVFASQVETAACFALCVVEICARTTTGFFFFSENLNSYIHVSIFCVFVALVG